MTSSFGAAGQAALKTILVVDDLAIFREPIAAALEQNGFNASTAASGAVALAAIRASKPDLILLDFSMPGMTGLEMVEAMLADPQTRDIPVIMLTATCERDSILRAAKLGIQDYILKSNFNLEELVSRVRRRLSGPPAAAPQVASVSDANAPPVSKPVPSLPPSRTPAVSNTTNPTAPVPPAIEAMKSVTAIITRAQVEQRLKRCGELKAFSPAIAQIIQVTNQPTCSVEHVANLIRQDQAVALKILKLANSVVYTRGEPVESVLKAVTRIGLAQIRQAVLNISVIEAFPTGMGEEISGPQFWEHAIACGLISAELVHSRGGRTEDADTAFTIGLLHDVGRMVLTQELGDIYPQVLQTAYRLQLPLEQVESRMLGVNHADVMEQVLVAWRFPKHLIGPVAMHHLSARNIAQLAPNLIQPITTLALANCLAHALLLGSSGNLSIYSTVELAASLRLDPAVITRIVEKIPDQTQDMKLTMLSKSSDAGWTPMFKRVRERIGSPIRPLCVSGSPQTDAMTILAGVLGEPDPEQRPNLAVVHITDAREIASLTKSLKAAEAAAEVSNLPLLLVSPTGRLVLEEGVMAGRRVQAMARPFAVARFVSAVKSLMAAAAAAKAA